MTPFTVVYVESVTPDHGIYRVAWVRDGLHRDNPVGPTFTRPKDAAAYARRLEVRATKEVA